MKIKIKADNFYGKIQKAAWVLLSLLALYILAKAGDIAANPCENLGEIRFMPQLVEHLLAGCVVLLAGGALFEYITSE